MKKRFTFLILGIVMLFSTMVISANAASEASRAENREISLFSTTVRGTYGDLTWEIDSDGVLTISGSGEMVEYTSAGFETWKNYRSSIKSVVIEAGITSIDYMAFYSCNNITEVTIPDSITSIGGYAFYGCSSLTRVVIPAGVTSIGSYAFAGCSSMSEFVVDADNVNYKSVGGIMFSKDGSDILYYPPQKKDMSYIIPAGVTKIGDYAFASCKNLTNITIPDGVESIGSHAFSVCSALSGITIPDSVESIGDYAFNSCSGFSKVTIPSSVISIDANAFYNCRNLKEVTISDGVESIGNYAFQYCYYIENITIPDSIVDIGNNAFTDTAWYKNEENWENDVLYAGDLLISAKKTLTEYSVKDGTKVICGSAFRDCTALTSITIPDSVIKIGNGAFYNCSTLEEITIPDDVEYIGDYAFYKCSTLTEIVIPDGVTSIEEYVFGNCTALVSITLPDGITGIGERAFNSCSKIENIIIPDSVESIGEYAFGFCSKLANIEIPANVKSIGTSALRGCSSLREITVDENNVNYKSVDGVLFSKDGKDILYYPAKKDATQYIIPDGTVNICDDVFYTNSTLTDVVIPDSVVTIGNWAFASCSKLEVFKIPDGIKSIGNYAFYSTKLISNITIPESIIFIGEFAFTYCDIETVTIEEGVDIIDDYAFYACTNLSSVIIPDSVKIIGEDAFGYCENLKSVKIPEGVTRIGNRAFERCSGLESIMILSESGAFGTEVFLYASSEFVIKGYTGSTAEIYASKNNHTFEELSSDGIIASGSCGENLTWTLDIDGALAIKGTGAMTDYASASEVPWYSLCNYIETVTAEEGMTSIGGSAFINCSAMTKITIPESVTSIGRHSFLNCSDELILCVTADSTAHTYAVNNGLNYIIIGPVTDVAVKEKSKTSVTLSYTEPSDYTSIEVHQLIDEVWTKTAATITEGQAIIDNLTAGEEYKFKLVVTGETNAGDSNIVIVYLESDKCQLINSDELTYVIVKELSYTLLPQVSEKATYETYDSNNQLIVDNELILNYGENKFVIRVIAENKEYKDYKIAVYVQSNKCELLNEDELSCMVENTVDTYALNPQISEKATYEIYDGNNKILDSDEVTLEVGINTFKVKVIAENGTDYKAYTVTITREEKKSIPKLTVATELEWKNNSVAVWSQVENAVGYKVQLYKGATAYGNAVETTNTSYDFANAITESGEYSFTVVAVSDGINYTDSDVSVMSGVYSYTKDIPIVKEKLTAPGKIRWISALGAIATWNEVANAAGYKVQLYKDGVVYTDAMQITETWYDFSYIITQTGEYTVTVITLGDDVNYTDSDVSTMSDVYSYTASPLKEQLKAPDNVIWSDGAIATAMWNKVEGAIGYRIQLYKDDSIYGDFIEVTEVGYDFASVITEDGEYSFTVAALGEGERYTDSEEVISEKKAIIVSEDDNIVCDISEMTIKSASGEETAEIPKGNFIAEITVSAIKETSDVGYVIVCAYDEDGALVDIGYVYIAMNVLNDTKIGVWVRNNGSVEKVKAFVWSDFTSMTPLADTVEIV